MRIAVDPDTCTGHGRCDTLAPDVCEADDDGDCTTRARNVPPELEDQDRTGARNCPERAIRVVES